MNTLLTRRSFIIGLRFSVLVVLLLLATFAIQALAQEVIDEEITVSEELPADIFVPESLITPALTTLLEETATETTTDSAVLPSEEASAEGESDLSSTTYDAVVDWVEVLTPSTTEEMVDEASATQTPTLSTDKEEYHPEEVATIFGKFFNAFQDIVLKIFAGSIEEGTYIEDTRTVTTDENGSFSTEFTLGGLAHAFYNVIASSLNGDILAEMTFIDPPSVDFKQCANKNPTLGSCDWINGILQANNSQYFEGMSVPQRLLYRGLGNGVHTMSFDYSYTKGGIHAYDFITGKNQGNPTITTTTFNNCAGLNGPDLTACNALVALSPTMISIPTDSFDSKDSAPAAGTGSTQAAKEAAYETTFGDRLITMHSNGTVSSPSIGAVTHTVGANGDTGDSDAGMTVTFTLTGCNAGCNVLFYFDGHLAVTGTDNTTGSNWGPGLGSSAISGGPYHIKGIELDGAGGSLDNQIQGSTILIPNNASITIIKDAVPNDAQDFAFTTTGTGLSGFSLDDDDANATLSNTKVFNSLTAGTYTITEGTVAGWSLTGNLNCVDPTTNSTINLGTRTATINLAAGENVTCTFVNTLQTGNIIIVKDAVPNDAQDFVFTNNFANGNPASFSLDDDADGTLLSSRNSVVTAGTYAVSEDAVSGWTQTSATCSDGSPIGAVVLSAGETVTCTFTNTKQAHLIVDKVTNPIGDPQSFNFTTNAGSNFSLTDTAAPNDSGAVAPGTYSVAETVPSGWDLSSATCSDGSPIGAVVLSAGETVTCTFTNTKRGEIVLVKNTVGGDGSFDFTHTIAGLDTNLVTAAGTDSDTSDKLVPGDYSISETVPAGWDLTSATCDNNSTTANITVTAGQTTTCTFTNTKKGQLTVQKTTLPAGDTTSFSILASGSGTITSDGAGSITDASDKVYEVTPGTYSVAETVPSDWTKTGDTCQNVTVAAGESKTCLITNTKNGSITIEKQVVGTDKSFTFTGSIAASLADNQTATLVVAPGSYSVTEGADAAYALTSLVCSDDDSTGNTNTRTASFVVAAGENVTCVFTNSQLPKLTLVKTVTNDNGGGAVTTDFQGKINGNNVPWASAQTLTPGSFTASETNLSTYDAGAWGVNCAENGTITLAYGDNKTCTITNNDKPGTLIVKKVVIKDNGGTKEAADFSFSVNDGSTVAFESDGQNDLTVNAGTYSVTEPAVTGYATTYTNCTNVLIPNGGTATCTVTNDDNAPSLTLNKIVVNNNGGTAAESAWTLTATGALGTPTNLSGAGAAGSADVVSGATFKADTYTLAETGGQTGYTASAWSCTNGVVVTNNQITLGLSQSTVCSITNDDQPGRLIVIKHVINDNGDMAAASDFIMHLTGTNLSQNDFAGSETGVTVTLNAGAYTADEINNAGYTKTLSAECSGTIAVGQTKTCTITNNDRASATRTQGFWKTHTTYTTQVLGTNTFTIGSHAINSPAKLFAGFYASLSKTSAGGKRSALDQARMQLLQQWLAAKLNCTAFGCSTTTQTLLNNAATAFAGTNQTLIKSYATQLDAYNNSNDALPISAQGKATPQTSQSTASSQLSFWNTLP